MRRALLAVLALGACNPYLTQQSAAPPGRSARLEAVHGFWDIKGYRLELSQGVALAMTCNEGGPCQQTVVVADDPSIIEVRPATLGYAWSSPSSAFVLIGKVPGTTKLHVRAKEGKRDVLVTVIAPPVVRETPVATGAP